MAGSKNLDRHKTLCRCVICSHQLSELAYYIEDCRISEHQSCVTNSFSCYSWIFFYPSPHCIFTIMNHERISTFQFCFPVFLGMHRNPNWKGFFEIFEHMHDVQKIFLLKNLFWSIMKMTITKNIPNLSQGSPNPGFR